MCVCTVCVCLCDILVLNMKSHSQNYPKTISTLAIWHIWHSFAACTPSHKRIYSHEPYEVLKACIVFVFVDTQMQRYRLLRLSVYLEVGINGSCHFALHLRIRWGSNYGLSCVCRIYCPPRSYSNHSTKIVSLHYIKGMQRWTIAFIHKQCIERCTCITAKHSKNTKYQFVDNQ